MLLEVELPKNGKADFAIQLSNAQNETYQIGFDQGKNEFYSDRRNAGSQRFSDKFASKRHVAPRIQTNKLIKLHLFFDVASCELFADGGEVAMTEIFFPTTDFTQIQLKRINIWS